MEIEEEQYEVYTLFGVTAEMAQVLETEAGNVLLDIVSLTLDPASLTLDERRWFQAQVETINRKTLGNLLKMVKSAIAVDGPALKIIDEALERRNYVMHHFFRAHNFAIYSAQGRVTMVDELRDARDRIHAGHSLLLAISSSLELLRKGGPLITEDNARSLMKDGRRLRI